MKKYLYLSLFLSLVLMPLSGVFAEADKSEVSPYEGIEKPADPKPSLISGKVVETMDAGGYTYVHIDVNGEKIWAAIPLTIIITGQDISIYPGYEMGDFTSKSLKRTFKNIIFSSGVAGESKSAGSKKMVVTTDEKINVERAEGPNSYSVAELYAKKASLDKTEIAVKGKVVKVSPEIMNRNWIHIQDGSGSAENGTHNLVITSQDTPQLDDIITAKGTLSANKDFGGGYKYIVVLEDAKITK